MEVRPERPEDIGAIHAVNEAAFGRPDEADIADALRANGKAFLSLVAVAGGRVVGHAMFSPATIESGGKTIKEAALGPIAVAPELQRTGIGSALVGAGLEACRALGYGSMFLLGDPAYYGRFGFVPATRFGIRYATELTHPDAFQAIELRPGALAGISGVAHEEPELG